MPRAIQFLFGQFVPQCNHRISKRFDDYYVLQYMDGGVVALNIGEKTYRLEGRQFWSSFPGPKISFHSGEQNTPWVHRYLAFRGAGVRPWIRSGLFPIEPQKVSPSAEYAKRFDDLLELSRRTDSWGLARAVLLLETILTELAEARARPSAIPAWLESGLAKITALGSECDCEALATEAGMSARTFRRRFTAALGTSPRSYAIACRMGHARQMLGGTELPIKTIAEQLGYRDVFFFTRQFTALTGMSPGAYRKTKEA